MKTEIIKIKVTKEDKTAIKHIAQASNDSISNILYPAVKKVIKDNNTPQNLSKSVMEFTQSLSEVDGLLGKKLLKEWDHFLCLIL